LCRDPNRQSIFIKKFFSPYKKTRACLKKAFCKMCVTICGRFCPDEGAVAGYGNRIRAKYTAKWGVQIAGMIFQTRSGSSCSCLKNQSFCYFVRTASALKHLSLSNIQINILSRMKSPINDHLIHIFRCHRNWIDFIIRNVICPVIESFYRLVFPFS